jgi:hypothetical protein
VVVDYLDAVGISVLPGEADSPLLVDPNAVGSSSITPEFLQPVSRGHTQVVKAERRVQLSQFAQSDALQVRRYRPTSFSLEELLGLTIAEAPDHRSNITRRVTAVNTPPQKAQRPQNRAAENGGEAEPSASSSEMLGRDTRVHRPIEAALLSCASGASGSSSGLLASGELRSGARAGAGKLGNAMAFAVHRPGATI